MGAFKNFWLGTNPVAEIRETTNDVVGYDPVANVTPPVHSAVFNAKPIELISIDIVYRATQYLSTLVSELEIETFVDNKKVDNVSLVNKPDINQSRKAFIQETVSSMVLWGEAFWRISRNARAEVTNLEILDPETVTVDKRNGRLVFRVGNVEIERKSIKHLKLARIPGKLHGIGPIQASPDTFKFAWMMQDYIEQFFNVGITPRGVLKTTEQINAEDMQDAAQGFIKFLKENQQLAVLPGGLEYQGINLDPSATSFIEVWKSLNLKLCNLFGVPAEAMLAETAASTTYQNVQDSTIRMLQSTLARYMDEIEESLSDLLPGRRTVAFRETDLLRMNPLAQREAEALDIANGVLTSNEVRESRGLQPLATPAVELDKSVDKDSATADDKENGV
ncbi:phage portal protein [Rhodococcus fascians]|nr:phage portal protein [Rhodococcus fascians]MBY4416270.1 phage portal protein [Rhodococcus fascians]